MIRHISVSRVLVALGIVLLVTPALFPVQSVLVHETRPGTTGNGTQLEEAGYRIIAYENLSERGKELYRETLRRGGMYTVPLGEGASEFNYSTASDRDEPAEPGERRRVSGFVIKRPLDADLPPAHEPIRAAERAQERAEQERAARERAGADSGESNATAGNETATTPSAEERRQRMEERRQQIARYELMQTRTGPPPLTATSNLLRLLSVVVGVVAIGVGGYLSSRP